MDKYTESQAQTLVDYYQELTPTWKVDKVRLGYIDSPEGSWAILFKKDNETLSLPVAIMNFDLPLPDKILNQV